MKTKNLTNRLVKKYLSNIFGENPNNVKTFYSFDSNRLIVFDSQMKPIVIIPKDAIIYDSEESVSN